MPLTWQCPMCNAWLEEESRGHVNPDLCGICEDPANREDDEMQHEHKTIESAVNHARHNLNVVLVDADHPNRMELIEDALDVLAVWDDAEYRRQSDWQRQKDQFAVDHLGRTDQGEVEGDVPGVVRTPGGHTPGPWEVGQGVVRPASGGFEIASLSQHYEWGDAAARANAALIAAAPDLLEAAHDALYAMAHRTADQSHQISALREAIAKATGGAS